MQFEEYCKNEITLIPVIIIIPVSDTDGQRKDISQWLQNLETQENHQVCMYFA